MNTLIRWYGTQKKKDCNVNKEAKDENESNTDWTKPVPFEGEFIDCGKPTGKILLSKENGLKAGRKAVESYF